MAKKRGVFERALAVARAHDMASSDTVALLMVSGGSDSVALAYWAADMVAAGELGAVTMLHVNHKLRGRDSDDDAVFVAELAQRLGIPLFSCEVNVAGLVASTGGNMEAVARAARYESAREALESTCFHLGFSPDAARVFTAHTADDRVENFYMRSIVGTGPGGFRSMGHCAEIEGCRVCRPLLEVGRDELRAFIEARDNAVADAAGNLWREDATNADTDYFRAFVRHEIIPLAKKRNPALLETLTRTMNLIADEDDMLDAQAAELLARTAQPLGTSSADGVLLAPELAEQPKPLARRAVDKALSAILPADDRVETASIEACLGGLGVPGYVTNVQGDLAVSYNKHGLRIEPMAAFRARRKRG